MRILDIKNKNVLNQISIFLTKEEAVQFIGYLEDLINNPSHQHNHLMDEEGNKEITMWLYERNDLSNFPKKIQLLIENDKWD